MHDASQRNTDPQKINLAQRFLSNESGCDGNTDEGDSKYGAERRLVADAVGGNGSQPNARWFPGAGGICGLFVPVAMLSSSNVLV